VCQVKKCSALINDVLRNKQNYLGWEKASTLLKSEYDFDLLTSPSLTDFISQYVEGKFQSGILELLYAAQTDKRHFIFVSTVRGESWSASTAIFPCYKGCAKDTKLSILKEGAITMEQLEASMILFPNGALVNWTQSSCIGTTTNAFCASNGSARSAGERSAESVLHISGSKL
jgi:hypothetical protein